jgi:hypothetical protein
MKLFAITKRAYRLNHSLFLPATPDAAELLGLSAFSAPLSSTQQTHQPAVDL